MTKAFCVLIAILTLSCASFKKQLIKSGGRNEAIQNAILDFSSTNLYHRDTVFSVRASSEDDPLIVRVGKNSTKLLFTADIKAGLKSNVLPSRFVEKGGKLFIWWDDNYPLTEEAIAVFQKYNLFQDDEGGLITVPNFTTDDSKKAAHYYFCKNDLTKYKRVITSIGIGYYDPPKLNCNP